MVKRSSHETELRTRRRDLDMLGGAPNFISHIGFRSGSAGEGFEPSIRLTTDNGFRDSRGIREERLTSADGGQVCCRARQSARRSVS